jgi:hypothetical protein
MAMRAYGLIPPKTKVGIAWKGRSLDIRKKAIPAIPKANATGTPIETMKKKHDNRTIKNRPL